MAKAVEIINEASRQDIDLLVFGESWLSGYPAWIDHCPNVALWDDQATKKAYKILAENSVSVDGEEISRLCYQASKHHMALVVGLNEVIVSGPGNGTIFNAVILINQEGKIAVHHRKLMPTFTEKILYGLGDGAGLKAADLGFGRVGALICWEHWMPLARQAMHDSGELIHIALWPQVHEMLQLCSRHYAFEGRCYVLAVGQLMMASQIPASLDVPTKFEDNPNALLLNGGTCIIGPDGRYITDPVYDEEKLIIHTLDLGQTLEERMTLDVSGHYQRPDVFSFNVLSDTK